MLAVVALGPLADLGGALLVGLAVSLGPDEGSGAGEGILDKGGTVVLDDVGEGLVDGAEASPEGGLGQGLAGLVRLLALLGRDNDGLLPAGGDIEGLLVNEAVGAKGVDTAEVVGLTGEDEAVGPVLHKVGRGVLDQEPLKGGRHVWREIKKENYEI